MTLAEGPRDQARRETQLELNWSVLGRAFGQDGEDRREREREKDGKWRTGRIFLGFLWAGTEREIVSDRRRVRLAEINVISSCGRRKNSSAGKTENRRFFPFLQRGNE